MNRALWLEHWHAMVTIGLSAGVVNPTEPKQWLLRYREYAGLVPSCGNSAETIRARRNIIEFAASDGQAAKELYCIEHRVGDATTEEVKAWMEETDETTE